MKADIAKVKASLNLFIVADKTTKYTSFQLQITKNY